MMPLQQPAPFPITFKEFFLRNLYSSQRPKSRKIVELFIGYKKRLQQLML